MSSLSFPGWELSVLTNSSANGKLPFLECIEFRDLCHLIILAESCTDAPHDLALDLLRGIVAAVGLKISNIDEFWHTIHNQLGDLIPRESHPKIQIVRVAANSAKLGWISSDDSTHFLLHAPTRSTRPAPDESSSAPTAPSKGRSMQVETGGMAAFFTSSGTKVMRELVKGRNEIDAGLSTVDVMETVCGLLEGSTEAAASISLALVKRVSSGVE